MADTSRFTIICPCCEATLTIDAQTGAMLSHEEKAKPLASFDEMVKGLDKQKQMREQIFAQELSSMKDRDRILEENLQSQGYDLLKIPYVLQLNKRDLSNIVGVDDLASELQRKGEPVIEAVASTGQGVFDTLKAVAKQVLTELRKG